MKGVLRLGILLIAFLVPANVFCLVHSMRHAQIAIVREGAVALVTLEATLVTQIASEVLTVSPLASQATRLVPQCV